MSSPIEPSTGIMDHCTRSPAPEAQTMTLEQTPLSLSHTQYNPQVESPLYNIIPAEIRNTIFNFALLEYEDPAQPYDFQSYHYRPGYRCRRRLDTALLRTCRIVYLETRCIPLKNATQTFWMGWDERKPPERRVDDDVACEDRHRMRHLSAEDRQKLEHVQVFAQLFWLECEDSLKELLMSNGLAPKKIILTIRYTDWWSWENDAMPRFSRECLIQSLGAAASVEEFVIEFETLEKKKAQLEEMIVSERILECSVERTEGIEMRNEGCQLSRKTWTGTAVFDGDRYNHHGEGDTIDYYVVTATWRPCKSPSREVSLQGT